MTVKEKFEDIVFGAIEPLMPDCKHFYIITEDDLSDVRNQIGQHLEDNRDAFSVSVGDEGIEWEVEDLEKAEEHMKAKAAYDAITLLVSKSYRTYQAENFAEDKGDRGLEDYEGQNNFWL